MARRKWIETPLAYWRVDAATWHRFVVALRQFQQQPGATHCALELKDRVPADGVEVLVGEHTVSVGGTEFDFLYADSLQVTLREGWLEFGSDPSDTQSYFFPVPVDERSRSEAARVADHFTRQIAERSQQAAEERGRPTLSNRLLNFVEGHFALAMFLFFFVLLPGVVGLLHLLQLWLPWLRLVRDE